MSRRISIPDFDPVFLVFPQLQYPIARAMDFLDAYLDHGPRPAREVIAAARKRGITAATLRRAKRTAEVRSVKPDRESPWYWVSPEWALRTSQQRAAAPSPVTTTTATPGKADNQGAQIE